ncbi:MAG TPA: class I SAM-dependent methyltransferase [Methylomirabilota bacterium]|nr:class I SAM-dependent methyltransferase [Methylomirabilota bacterium]
MLNHRARNSINTVPKLRQRVASNQSSSRDFDRFVLGLMDLSQEDSVLDIGPGLGKQLIPVARQVRRVLGLDVSGEIIAALRSQMSSPSVELIVADMDNLAALDLGGRFSLVYAVYSLYYSTDPARVVRTVARLLEGPRARFLVVAPDLGNNAGWFADLSRLYELPADVLETSRICRHVILPAFRDVFPQVTSSTFQAEVRFSSVDELMAYYDACVPYCRPDRRAEAREYFRERFEREGHYRISKHSLALAGRPGLSLS